MGPPNEDADPSTLLRSSQDDSVRSEEDDDARCAESADSSAKIYLIGAGPGDPELLTVKALRPLQSADVVLHDDLVPQAILDIASPTAEVINVGKRCGVKTITQSEINARMIEQARAGRTSRA